MDTLLYLLAFIFNNKKLHVGNKKLFQMDSTQEKIKFILELFNSKRLIEAKKEIDRQLIIYSKSSVLFNILGAVLAKKINHKKL